MRLSFSFTSGRYECIDLLIVAIEYEILPVQLRNPVLHHQSSQFDSMFNKAKG